MPEKRKVLSLKTLQSNCTVAQKLTAFDEIAYENILKVFKQRASSAPPDNIHWVRGRVFLPEDLLPRRSLFRQRALRASERRRVA